MHKVKIKAIYINDKNAKGDPYINKHGQPYKRANLISETGNKASMYIGCQDDQWDRSLAVVEKWKAGDEVEIEIEQRGEYTNFRLPFKQDSE